MGSSSLAQIRTACLLVLILLIAAACGGMGAGLDGTTELAAWPGHGWDSGARSGSYVAVAVDSTERQLVALTNQLELSVEPSGGGERVRIRARGVENLDRAYLHLKYDGERMHPARTQCSERLQNRAAFIGVTERPGVVSMGLQILAGQENCNGDVELCLVEFESGAAMPCRRSSEVADEPVSDLRFNSTATDTLEWTYVSPGDYDQNSEVNVADVTPIGIYYRAVPSSPNWAKAQVADGDRNTEVNLADLATIAQHFLLRLTAYQVKSGSSDLGPFANVTDSNVPQSSSVEPPGGGFKRFSKQLGTLVDGAWYVVVALDGTTEAPVPSNAVRYSPGGSFNPPAGLTATSDGTNIQLSWSAPAGSTPDGYYAFLADNATMASALQLNTTPVLLTQYAVPVLFPPTNEYYFAVKAVYGADQSVYSNIFHYVPGGANDPPQNLSAAHVGDHIDLSWEAPASGTPDGYDAYVGTDGTMAGEIKLNPSTITDLTFSASTLVDPALEHWFGVKAKYGGTDSAYSNIYHYVPGGGPDTTPPVWQGPDGIQSVAPDDQVVTISWTAAVDADTPPVKYLLYHVPDTDEFDWNSPSDVVPAGTTTFPCIGLTNDVRYKFAVRAVDDVDPGNPLNCNMTTNTNFLYATPSVYPDDGPIGTVQSSDVAAVRMDGEEIPRVIAVNHTNELWYCVWNGSGWTTTDLNTTLTIGERKYHPQALGIGNDIHIVFGTPTGIYEVFGPKDADPATWTLNTIVPNGLNGVFGIGLSYSAADNYIGMVYAAKSDAEHLFYVDRDVPGAWGSPVSIFDGSPEIWQCDFVISPADGSQWAVMANGHADSSGDELMFFYFKRAGRSGAWNGGPSGYGGDVMVIDIDPGTGQPIVVDAEVRTVSVPPAGDVPVSDASVFLWSGTSWVRDGNPLDRGDAVFDEGNATLDTILTGQDPQLVFSPTGKAVALWTKLDFLADLIDLTADLTGAWRFSQRPAATWSAPATMLSHITSSNAVTAGDGYQHCVTCDLGFSDSGDYMDIAGKYSERNNYVAGDLYYRRQVW